MALIPRATLSIDPASTLLSISDGTGVYNATTNVNGYGSPNRAASDNILTELITTWGDGTVTTTVLNSGTLPTTNWIPKNALSASYGPSVFGLSGTYFIDQEIQMLYRPWFTTASAGTVNVTNGSATVTRNSAQDFTADFADSNMIRIAGVNYTIATKSSTTITLSTVYTGTTATGATAYIGYSVSMSISATRDLVASVARLISYYSTQVSCKSDKRSATMHMLIGVYAVEAADTSLDPVKAQSLIESLTLLADCYENNTTTSGCSGCG